MKKLALLLIVLFASIATFGQTFFSKGLISNGDIIVKNNAGLAINGDTVNHIYSSGDSLIFTTKGGKKFKAPVNPVDQNTLDKKFGVIDSIRISITGDSTIFYSGTDTVMIGQVPDNILSGGGGSSVGLTNDIQVSDGAGGFLNSDALDVGSTFTWDGFQLYVSEAYTGNYFDVSLQGDGPYFDNYMVDTATYNWVELNYGPGNFYVGGDNYGDSTSFNIGLGRLTGGSVGGTARYMAYDFTRGGAGTQDKIGFKFISPEPAANPAATFDVGNIMYFSNATSGTDVYQRTNVNVYDGGVRFRHNLTRTAWFSEDSVYFYVQPTVNPALTPTGDYDLIPKWYADANYGGGSSTPGSDNDILLSDGAGGMKVISGFNYSGGGLSIGDISPIITNGTGFTPQLGNFNQTYLYAYYSANDQVNIALRGSDIVGSSRVEFNISDNGTLYPYHMSADGMSLPAGITIGNSVTDIAGTMRWTGTDFEGYDGATWNSLGGGGGLPSGVQGDVLYHNGSDWVVLNAGTDGDLLQSQGSGADPQWVTPVEIPYGFSIQAYAAGTAYNLTASSALMDFGTTDPSVTFTQAGTYKITAGFYYDYSGATFGGNQTLTAKLRRTNNTASDVTNTTIPNITLDIVTTFTGGGAFVQLPPVIYTTVNTDDILQLWGNLSATPSAGNMRVTGAWINAERVY